MHVISRKKLAAFWGEQADAKDQLAAWFKVARKAKWARWADVRKAYPKASYFKCCLVFNVCGGSYRLVVRRAAKWGRLYVVGVFPHAEYDLGEWKKFCACRPAAGTREGKHDR